MTIQFDIGGESQTFEATRPIEGAEHANGSVNAAENVFFRRENDAVTLLFTTGEPTNGNQYIRFDTVKAAEEFAQRVGLLPIDVPLYDD